jgi:stage II sporulation protein D
VFCLFDPVDECKIEINQNQKFDLWLDEHTSIPISGSFSVKKNNEQGYIKYGFRQIPFRKLEIQTENKNKFYNYFTISLPGKISRKYYGGLAISCENEGFDIFVDQNPEDYVLTVLASESNDDQKEYLKAFSIIIRTYALSGSPKRHKGYDFCDNTHCQLFLGEDKDKTPYYPSVKETTGMVLTYNNEISDVYFCGACGGRTKTPDNIWENYSPKYPYREIECEFCKNSKYYKWIRAISKKDMKNLFFPYNNINNSTLSINKAKDKPEKINIQYGKVSQLLTIDEFRLNIGRNMGWNYIYSNNFNLMDESDSIIFSGNGFGHNLGFCQSGAEEMSRQACKFEKILLYYYPESIIAKVKLQ